MTIFEFLSAMREIQKAWDKDQESAHSKADKLLVTFIRAHFKEEEVAKALTIYEENEKWYA